MEALVVALSVALISVRIVSVVICFMKRKFAFGIFGILVPFVALIGAVGYAKPSAEWATRYGTAKMAEAMALYPWDPLVKEVSTRKRIVDLVPGDRIGNPAGMHYEVTTAPVIVGHHLTYSVVKANGDEGTRRWFADEGSKKRLIWNPNAVDDLAAAR